LKETVVTIAGRRKPQ